MRGVKMFVYVYKQVSDMWVLSDVQVLKTMKKFNKMELVSKNDSYTVFTDNKFIYEVENV